MNAGDGVRPDYPPNVALDISHARSRVTDQFETRSSYVLALTDMLLSPQLLFGIGVGTEYTRESLLGGSVKHTRGLTGTMYFAAILNENFTLVPQAALSVLEKEKTLVSGQKDDDSLTRTLISVAVLGQKQWGALELSGFGQYSYTNEDGSAFDEDIYLGQVIAGAEIAFKVKDNARLFMGASMDYDLIRPESTSDKFGWEGKVGLRSQLGSNAEFSLSISTSRKDEEETTSGNIFVKFFF